MIDCSGERHYTVGKFISKGRHGKMEPGIPGGNAEDNWMVLY